MPSARRRLRLLAAVLLLGGCALTARRDPSRFYALTSIAAAGGGAVGSGASRALGVGPVTLPRYLDRAPLVTRVGPNEVRVAEIDRWAEPLAGLFTRTLADNLATLLTTNDVRLYPWFHANAPDLAVEVDVLQFEADAEGQAQLVARWRIRDGHGSTLLQARESRFTEPMDGRGPEAAVAALSRTLAALSREIAAALAERS
jgi:uncharacterized lipoprotein YmbA